MFLVGEDIAALAVQGGLVQPAGVDLSLWEVEVLEGAGVLGRAGRQLPPGRPLEPGGDGFYTLDPGVYRIRFREVVRVPPWAVGFCFPRSSLLRMGVYVGCAVWDPGYEGRGQALMLVANPAGVRIERGVGVAQLVLARLERATPSVYRGFYQGEGLPQSPRGS